MYMYEKTTWNTYIWISILDNQIYLKCLTFVQNWVDNIRSFQN